MSGIISATDINVAGIKFDNIKKRGDGGAKGVRMTINGHPIVIQIPSARIPFGLSSFENEKTKDIKYGLELSLDDVNPKLDKFRSILGEIDEKIINYVSDNSESADWWKRKMSATVIKQAETYKSMVKPDKKGESPPRFRVKLPLYKGKPGFSVFNKGDKTPLNICDEKVDNAPINWEWAQNGMEATIICECEGLWVIGNNVYCTWRALLIKVNRESNRISGYVFMDEDGVDNSTGSIADADAEKSIEDEEEEDDEEYIEEEEN